MLTPFLERLSREPESVEFTDTMAVIEQHYDFTPTAFKNGEVANAADQNSGSCKIFAFAQLHSLSEQQTLACFGRYYRDDVMPNPEGDDHQNIRQFIRKGWGGIYIDGAPLQAKTS